MKPTTAQFEAYQNIFDYFNQTLFDDILPDCMLRFSRRKANTYKLFTADRWAGKEKGKTPEISLSMECLQESSPKEVASTLVREMVRLWQETYGQPSRAGYYNREWSDKMEEVGLIASSTGKPGGKRTGQGLKHYIEEGGRFERTYEKMPVEYMLPFEPTYLEEGIKKTYSEKVKYTCEGCGVKVWGKSGLGFVCQCGGIMVAEGEEGRPEIREQVYRLLLAEYREKGKRVGFVPQDW